MRVTRQALVRRAVAVIEEAHIQARQAPVQPGPGLRLALAYLYAVSDDQALPGHTPRQAFDDFLRAVANERVTSMPDTDGRARWAEGLPLFNHICRRVGHGS